MKLLSKYTSSIKIRLIFISSLILIIPMLFIGSFSFFKSSHSLDELGKSNLENSVEHTIQLISALHEHVENGLITKQEAQSTVILSILGEKQPDGTRPINDTFDLGEHGYMYIADSKGNLIAHPTIEGANTWDRQDINGNYYAREYIKKGLEGGGFTYYPYPLPSDENRIEEKVSYSKAFPEWDWIVVASTYMVDFNKPANEILTTNIIIFIISLILGGVVIWIFANRIAKPIHLVTERMDQLANRNLSLEPLQIKSKDETGKLAHSMNKMQTELKNMLYNISETSTVVATASEELSQSTNEIKTGAEQVVATMQELASGADSQANDASNLATAMNDLTSQIQEANGESEIVNEHSQNVIELTNEGSQLMCQSVQQMDKINQIVQDVVNKMDKLEKQSEKISSLVTVINDIAEQTNLLSLNASIEAARAGEHGKGFAVVANEVGKLSEQVSKSVVEITDIVRGILEESKTVSDSLKNGFKEVELGKEQIETTGQTFTRINEAINEVDERIATITNNLTEITSNTEKMNTSIENIAAVSEESAAGVEESTASAQQTSSSMEEIAKSSEELAETAEKLNDLVQRFKL